jgi:hypothetical protein
LTSVESWRRPDGEPPPFTSDWWRWAGRWIYRELLNGIRAADGRPELTDLPRMSSRTLLIALSIVGLIPAVIGLALDVGGFLAHVLAGMSALILGAVLLRQRRRAQWETARNELRRAICEGVVDLASSFALVVPRGDQFLGLVGPEDAVLPRRQIATALQQLVATTEAEQGNLAGRLEPDIASTRNLYDEVSIAIAPFRSAMATRVIALGDESHLVTALLTLERTERQWRSWVETVEQWGAPDLIAWSHATGTLRAESDLYRYFVSHDL